MERATKTKLEKHREDFLTIRECIVELASLYPTDIRQDNLLGACAVASYIVFNYLVKKGYNPKFKVTDFHCWVQVDKYYIDLTATQYGIKDKVFIHTTVEFDKIVKDNYDYANSLTLNEANQLKKHVLYWSNGQNPFYLERKCKTMKLILKEFV